MRALASFRFLNLSDIQAKELADLIPNVEIGEHFETKNNVGCINLDRSTSIEEIGVFAKQHEFKPTDCDIFISIASENQDEIWRAPKAVNNMLKIFDCPIVFSYTC